MIRFMIVEGFKSFFRAKFSSLLTILSMVFALLLISIIAIGSVEVETQLLRLKRNTPVTIYFPLDMNESAAKKICANIRTFNGISQVNFVSKTDGIKTFNSMYNTDVKKILGKNPLPHSAVVKFSNVNITINDFTTLKTRVTKLNPNIDVIYNSEAFLKLEKYVRYLTNASLALTLFVIVVSVILMVNTIRLSIHDKRLIIRTMKLVGAKDRFIKSPFLFEGFLQSVIAFGIVLGLTYYLDKMIIQQFHYKIQFHKYHYYAIGLLSFLMTLLGTQISVRKYLKWNFR